MDNAKQLTTLEPGTQLKIVAFKTTKTKYGDTFIICTKKNTEYKSYWSTAQLTAYLSKIMQDGRNKLDIHKNKIYDLLEGPRILIMLVITIRDIVIDKTRTKSVSWILRQTMKNCNAYVTKWSLTFWIYPATRSERTSHRCLQRA